MIQYIHYIINIYYIINIILLMTETFSKLEQKIENETLYQMMELQPDCQKQEIKKAYKRMARMYHPDKIGYYDQNDRNLKCK